MTLANTLFIEPTSIFGVNWTAYMIFMVLVGGLGTFEGPIIGAIVLFLIQNQLGSSGAWYLVGLGGASIAVRAAAAAGALGHGRDRFRIQLLPVGYRLQRCREAHEHGNDVRGDEP